VPVDQPELAIRLDEIARVEPFERLGARVGGPRLRALDDGAQ
jgi:hypothetical protein